MKIRYGLALVVSFLFLVAATSSYAETGFSAHLSGLQEVPANPSPATGYGTVVLNDAQNSIHVHLEFSGLLGPQTAAHIHGPAAPGVNAGVLIPLPTGTPIDLDVAVTPTQVGYLQGGLLYFNVHSTVLPGGEIRGQMTSDPTPTENVSWGRIKALYQ